MVNYSPRAARALGYLKRHSNDIEIYVEDKSCANIWLHIIRRALGPDIKLKTVNMLGNRTNVVDACKLDQANDGRKRLYIIDGDYDDLIGKKDESLSYFYKIKAYCVENLLIHEKPVTEVCGTISSTDTADEIFGRIKFKEWLDGIRRDFRTLFAMYATSEALSIGVPTTSHSVGKLCKSAKGQLVADRNKIATRINSLKAEIVGKVGLSTFRKTFQKILRRSKKKDPALFVSGKDYILPLMLSLLKHKAGFTGNADGFRAILARFFDFRNDRGLRRALTGV